jgi:DNA-binding NarL/FixJ family response regulator
MGRTILIVEDHRAMRDALTSHVSDTLSDTTVIACASPAEIPHHAQADLALVDLDLGEGVESLDAVRQLVERCGAVLVMSAAGSASAVQMAIQAGAWTYVPKSPQLSELDDALNAWMRGVPFLSSELAGKLVTPQIPGVELDERTRRALALHSTGMSLRAISQTMGITTADAEGLLSGGIAAYSE